MVLAAKLDPDAAWLWLSRALIAVAVHILVAEPLRVILIAFYWTVFRHELLQ